jgi:ribosomal protein S10
LRAFTEFTFVFWKSEPESLSTESPLLFGGSNAAETLRPHQAPNGKQPAIQDQNETAAVQQTPPPPATSAAARARVRRTALLKAANLPPSLMANMSVLCSRIPASSAVARVALFQGCIPFRSASSSSSSSSSSHAHSSEHGIAQVRMRGFDPVSLQSVASQVVAAGVSAGLSMSGIIPRPKLTRLYTVLRSPHIDKKARDQFHMIVRCASPCSHAGCIVLSFCFV